MDKMREAFEYWARHESDFLRGNSLEFRRGDYTDADVGCAWEVWKAAISNFRHVGQIEPHDYYATVGEPRLLMGSRLEIGDKLYAERPQPPEGV